MPSHRDIPFDVGEVTGLARQAVLAAIDDNMEHARHVAFTIFDKGPVAAFAALCGWANVCRGLMIQQLGTPGAQGGWGFRRVDGANVDMHDPDAIASQFLVAAFNDDLDQMSALWHGAIYGPGVDPAAGGVRMAKTTGLLLRTAHTLFAELDKTTDPRADQARNN